MAPDLVQIRDYFKHADVAFVSLSPDGESTVRHFRDRHQIDWPMGWGAEKVIGRFFGRRFPTLLVVGRDGRIAWNDGNARLQHRQPEASPLLFDEINKALKRF